MTGLSNPKNLGNLREVTNTKLISGLVIKFLGYLVTATGIFLALGNKEFALKVVVSGVFIVVFGWILVFFGVERRKID